jgi:transcriptional regulator with XRE-family HTH domain
MARPPSDLNPSAGPLALFGSELRRYRERAVMSQDQLGAEINYSGSFIGQVERGEKRCERILAVRTDELFGLPDALTNLWDKTIKSNAFPSWFDWPIYEAQATTLCVFQLSVIYGLLQTKAYASDLLHGDEEAVAARLARQDILTRTDPPPPHLFCLLDEFTLLREIGDSKVMAEQLEHLTASASERISIQIIPARKHRGISGSFVIATLADGSEVAYLETAARGMTLGSRDDLRTLKENFGVIRSRALPVEMSMDFIARTAEERWT